MNRINVKDELPEVGEMVLVWIRYEGYDYFSWDVSELDHPSSDYYIEPNSGKCWLMGSAKNYEITHWARVERP